MRNFKFYYFKLKIKKKNSINLWSTRRNLQYKYIVYCSLYYNFKHEPHA